MIFWLNVLFKSSSFIVYCFWHQKKIKEHFA